MMLSLNFAWTCLLFLTLISAVRFSHEFDDNRFLSAKKYGKFRTDQIIKFYGYPAEKHKVLTEDGYILTNFRMPNPGGYPILMLHGLSATSDCWLVSGAANDLSFRLWRRGYDIWLMNTRGNMYSKEHVNVSYSQEKFFLFSMHELGIYDTTASIDYILNVTGHKDVITIGHSMGTTNVLIAASVKPEYQAKVRLNILWAQGVLTRRVIIKTYADMAYTSYVRWMNFDSLERVLDKGSMMNRMVDFLCDSESTNVPICMFCMGFTSGFFSNQTYDLAVLKMMTKFPAGTSMNVVKQQIQNSRAGTFSPLSYGRKENLKRYGTEMPQEYPIGKVKIATAIYFGCCNDYLSLQKDAIELKRRLPHVVHFYKVPYKMFNHGDFLWAKEAYRLIYRDALILIDQYTPLKYRSNITIV